MWNFSSLSSSYYYGSIVRLRRIRAWFFDVKYVWKSEVLQQSHRKMPDKLLVSAFSPCCASSQQAADYMRCICYGAFYDGCR
jgi:hypothetical protein